ncbi:hypothetical protein JCM33774_46170 [Actinophytocola sp. KF-1]
MTRQLPSVINIVFDGPPSHEEPRFVEVEDDEGHSIRVGEWVPRGDGSWALRIEWTAPAARP